jgi:N-acetylglutamate synthase-like GNAT family acetyltransferase
MSNGKFITLTKENINTEHICCAISDKKCAEGYEAKKQWLENEFDNGYIFRRLNERAKVFIEYCPAEKAWSPVNAPNYLMLNCFWVSGQYKGKGYAKALLQSALDDAKSQKKDGLVTVVGTKKLPFMSDTKWLLRHGFEIVEELTYGFNLLARKLNPTAKNPSFKKSVATGKCPEKKGLAVYYTNRCPYTEYHIQTELIKTAKFRKIPLKVIKLETMKQAQSAPTPATIFSLFLDGKFVTTDISSCMDNRFDKMIKTCK